MACALALSLLLLAVDFGYWIVHGRLVSELGALLPAIGLAGVALRRSLVLPVAVVLLVLLTAALAWGYLLQEDRERPGLLMSTETTLTDDFSVGYPAGALVAFRGALTEIPDGWSVADGRSLPIADYGDLYAQIGTAFGGGDGSFRLPDFRGMRTSDFSTPPQRAFASRMLDEMETRRFWELMDTSMRASLQVGDWSAHPVEDEAVGFALVDVHWLIKLRSTR